MMNKSRQLAFKIGGFTEDEKLVLKRKISKRFKKKLTGLVTLHLCRKRQISLIISYMYGGHFHIKRSVKGKETPLNLHSKMDDIINIIEYEKSSL